MLKLRSFESQDAKYILSWTKDEEAFRKWSADRYQTYPAKPEDMIQMRGTSLKMPQITN